MLALDRGLGKNAVQLGYLRLAMDRGTVRDYDNFGRLHVKLAHISKSNVCPYYGREIPNGQALGLAPDRIYNLLRDPEELRKSVPSWNNLPLLDMHLPTSAAEPQKDFIAGSTGTDASFSEPYLDNSLVVWTGEAIAYIESDDKRELSCGYSYVADMTPGEYQGEKYDGVMREIVGNHVALVEEGRAGRDVVIGDSKLKVKKGNPMIKTTGLTSRKALLVQGALAAHLAPLLAADAKIDLTPVLSKVTRANFKKQQPNIMKGLRKACEGKLAEDADLEAVAEVLEGLENINSEGEDCIEAKDEDPDDEKDGAKDADPDEKDKDAKDAEVDEKVDTSTAKDADPDEKDKDAKDADPDKVDKGAMDAAIAKAVTKAQSDTRRQVMGELGAIETAKAAVKPFIGEVTGQSASEIYKMALDAAIDGGVEIDLDGVPTSAYAALVKMLLVPGAESKTINRQTLASDAAAGSDFTKRFPGAARIRHV